MSILKSPGWTGRIDLDVMQEAREAYFPELNKNVEFYANKYYKDSIESGTIDRLNKLIIKMLRLAILKECDNRNDEFASRLGSDEGETKESNVLTKSDTNQLINVVDSTSFNARSGDFSIGDTIYFAKKGGGDISFTIEGANVIVNEDDEDGLNGLVLLKNLDSQFLVFNDFKQQYKVVEKEITGLFDAAGNRIRHGVVEHRITLQKIYDLRTKGLGSKVIPSAVATLVENLKASIANKPTDYMQDISMSIWAHKATLPTAAYIAKKGGDESTPDFRFKINEWSTIKQKIQGVVASIQQEDDSPLKEGKLKIMQLMTAIFQKYSNILDSNFDVAEIIINAVTNLRTGTPDSFIEELIGGLSVAKKGDPEAEEMYEDIVEALTSYNESVKLTPKQTDRLLQEQYIKRKQFAYRIEEFFKG